MKVAFVTPHTNLSGGVKVIFSFAQHLAELGVDTYVLSMKGGNLSWLNHLKPFKFKLSKVGNINKYNLPKGIDFLITYGDWDPYVSLPEDIKHILFLQGFGTQNNTLEKLTLGYKYDAVFATSSWLARLANRCGQNNLFLTPPGIDKNFSRKNVPINKNTVGTLYHPAPSKNFSLFANAVSKLRYKNKVDPHPIILSAHEIKDEDMDLLKNSVNDFSVYIRPDYNMLPYVYSQCRVWFSPSRSEGFGLTTLEAMACEVPVVWFNSFGLDDYLRHGENCFIVNDKETGVNSIYNLLQDQNKRKRFAAEGLKTIKNCSWKIATDKFMKGLKAVL